MAPVRYEVEPERIVGIGAAVVPKTREAIEDVFKKGLRATWQSVSLITGQQMVAMEFVPDAPPAQVTMEGTDFVMPTTAGGGFAGLQTSAADLLDKVNTIPFQQIGENLNGILLGRTTIANGATDCSRRWSIFPQDCCAERSRTSAASGHRPAQHCANCRKSRRAAKDADQRQQAGAVARQRLWGQYRNSTGTSNGCWCS